MAIVAGDGTWLFFFFGGGGGSLATFAICGSALGSAMLV